MLKITMHGFRSIGLSPGPDFRIALIEGLSVGDSLNAKRLCD
jgi:hypothetical protein